MELILASQSPRRRQLLTQLGLHFTVQPAQADETFPPELSPEEAVALISARKAAAAVLSAPADAVVLAADTIVVVEDRILGKPRSEEEAREMLRQLSGRSHRVMTGVTLRQGSRAESFTEITELEFRPLSEGEIRAYVATGDSMDKAGAYGVQGLAAAFVRRLRGDYFNVMGLPLCALCEPLRRFEIAVLGEKG